MDFGFLRIAAVVPTVTIADCSYNIERIVENIRIASNQGAKIILFPELSITSYTCGDLFWQSKLLNSAIEGVISVKNATNKIDSVIVVGAPLKIGDKLCNCAVVIAKGQILGIVPKTYIRKFGESPENRWFSSASFVNETSIIIDGENVPVGNNLLFVKDQIKIAIEVGSDLQAVFPPSSYDSQYGANIILNPSAFCELVGGQQYLRNLIQNQSSKTKSVYICASAGFGESTTDCVFSGNAIIAENGYILKEAKRFNRDDSMVIVDVDIELLNNEKIKSSILEIENTESVTKYHNILIAGVDFCKDSPNELLRRIERNPFIPSNNDDLESLCESIVNTQVYGLIKRLIVTGTKNVVIGVSGGLDSTLALLICHKAFNELGYDLKGIKGITMPGFGTTDRTYINALSLMMQLDVYQEEISIKEAVVQHFFDISHDINIHDVTYENSQARERTQILMDYSNKCNGMVIGTGDLSELALGWATYNGDHMSMYGVNADVPKTLVRYLVKWIALKADDKIKSILLDILDTPISPELVPADELGNIKQKTEDLVGPYELHDFYLYHILRNNYSPAKVYYLANKAFEGEYSSETIKKWLMIFCRRFFQQQFKRSCLPDGPQIGSISLSPRGGLSMPSDASVKLWLDECESL